MSIKQLRARWTADADLLARGWAVLEGEPDIPGLALVDGRIDLRGIPAPPSATPEEPWRPPWIEGVALARLDLSHGDFERVRLIDVALADCVLDGIDLRDAIVRGGGWTSCRLVGARLAGAHVSDEKFEPDAKQRFDVEDCDLTKADLRKSSWTGSDLRKVTLASAKLAKATFADSTLTSVTFEQADLTETAFGAHQIPDSGISVRLTDVDVSRATLTWTEFRAAIIERCTFPPGTRLVPHYPAAVRTALEATREHPGDHQLVDEWLGGSLRQSWAAETTGVLIDPAPLRGHETPSSLALRVFTSSGVELIEV